MATDSLIPLFGRDDGRGLKLHQGEIMEWSSQDGTNRVACAGTELVNLPMLNLTEALTLHPGVVVAVLSDGNQWWILGRLTLPNTAQFFSGAMPDVASPFYQVNTDGPLQTTAVGNYYSKMISAHIINHPRVDFGCRAQVSTLGSGTCTGAYRVQWYDAQPPNTANPTGGTSMALVTGLVGGTGTDYRSDHSYTWPAGMRGRLVYVSYEPALTASSGGGLHWAAVMPSYFVGSE